MKKFFRFLEEHYPPGGFTTQLKARFGEQFGFLEAAEIMEPSAPGDQYPCPQPNSEGCPRRVVRDSEGGLLAICGNSPPICETLVLSDADVRRHRFSMPGLARELCMALGIEHRYTGKRLTPVTFFLGEGQRASHSIRFYISMKPGARGMRTLVEYIKNDAGDPQCIILVPSVRKLDPELERECRLRGITFVPLDECCSLESTQLRIDLPDSALSQDGALKKSASVCTLAERKDTLAEGTEGAGMAQVLIHYPVPGQQVGHKVRLEGTAPGMDAKTILRTVVVPGTLPTFQPQVGRLHVDPVSFSVTGTTYVGNSEFGTHTGERFRVLVVRCSEAAEDVLDAYLSEAPKLGWPGMRRLPVGTRILAELAVVRDDYNASDAPRREPPGSGGEVPESASVHAYLYSHESPSAIPLASSEDVDKFCENAGTYMHFLAGLGDRACAVVETSDGRKEQFLTEAEVSILIAFLLHRERGLGFVGPEELSLPGLVATANRYQTFKTMRSKVDASTTSRQRYRLFKQQRRSYDGKSSAYGIDPDVGTTFCILVPPERYEAVMKALRIR